MYVFIHKKKSFQIRRIIHRCYYVLTCDCIRLHSKFLLAKKKNIQLLISIMVLLAWYLYTVHNMSLYSLFSQLDYMYTPLQYIKTVMPCARNCDCEERELNGCSPHIYKYIDWIEKGNFHQNFKLWVTFVESNNFQTECRKTFINFMHTLLHKKPIHCCKMIL